LLVANGFVLLLQLWLFGGSQLIYLRLAPELCWGDFNAVESSLWAQVYCCVVRWLVVWFRRYATGMNHERGSCGLLLLSRDPAWCGSSLAVR
jgi:hypothetical protein